MNGFKRILLITSEFPPGPGGIGNHAYNLARFLNLNNIEVEVLAVSDFVNEKEEKSFDLNQHFKIIRFKRYGNRIRTYLVRVKKILYGQREKTFNQIIFSGRFSLLVSLIPKIFNKESKFIAIVHGGDVNPASKFIKYLVGKALKRMDLIIPVSNFSKSKLPPGLSSKKIIVIPNGFDFENMATLNVSEKILQNGCLNLVTVGTVWPRKGHHNVINAFPNIISNHSHLKYNIVGRLSDLSKVKQFFEDEGIKKHLKIYGAISNEEVYEVLNKSQIFILLSESQKTGDFEGFGIAVLEANYFGLPAIGSKNCGLEDSINNGISGILVDPKNSEEISQAIEIILNNYTEFSQRAKTWANKHHWSNIIKLYINTIEKIV